MAQTLAQAVSAYPADDPDWQVADALNAPDASLPTKAVDVSVSDARAVLMTSGSWGGIVMAASDATKTAQVQELCITVRDAMTDLTRLYMSVPATNASVTGMMDGLLAASLITQATHDALLALSRAPSSWADVNNGGVPVTARDVGIARGGVA